MRAITSMGFDAIGAISRRVRYNVRLCSTRFSLLHTNLASNGQCLFVLTFFHQKPAYVFSRSSRFFNFSTSPPFVRFLTLHLCPPLTYHLRHQNYANFQYLLVDVLKSGVRPFFGNAGAARWWFLFYRFPQFLKSRRLFNISEFSPSVSHETVVPFELDCGTLFGKENEGAGEILKDLDYRTVWRGIFFNGEF